MKPSQGVNKMLKFVKRLLNCPVRVHLGAVTNRGFVQDFTDYPLAVLKLAKGYGISRGAMVNIKYVDDLINGLITPRGAHRFMQFYGRNKFPELLGHRHAFERSFVYRYQDGTRVIRIENKTTGKLLDEVPCDPK